MKLQSSGFTVQVRITNPCAEVQAFTCLKAHRLCSPRRTCNYCLACRSYLYTDPLLGMYMT